MNPWYGTALFGAAVVASILIRMPHDRRSARIRVVHSRRGWMDAVLFLAMVVAGLVLPLLYAGTRVLEFADYPLTPGAFVTGIVVVFVWIWLFQRSHADLGTNWSVSLEVREDHRLITTGVYTRVRHPMYAAIFAHALAQCLLLANWIAGPALLAAFTLMFTVRVSAEEQMMLEQFGDEYAAYAKRTKRLLPGIW